MGNLTIDQVLAAQDQKEVTINAATAQLESALTDTVLISVTSSNARTLTTLEFQRNYTFNVDEDGGDPATADITLTVPAVARGHFAVKNSTAFAVTVQISGQSLPKPVLAAGDLALLNCDGSDVVRAAGTTSFLGLTDSPSSFANMSARLLAVNDAESAIEFIASTFKTPVRAATTANGTLATDFENGDTIDGVTLATGDRILLKNQSTASENGIYTVNATGAPTRASDFDDAGDAAGGQVISVLSGTLNAGSQWVLTTTGTITIGTTALAFGRPNYEAGSWTPQLTAATPGDLSVAYSLQIGAFLRFGDLVVAFHVVQTSTWTHSTASGDLQLTGLPYQSNGLSSLNMAGACRSGNIFRTGYHFLVNNVSPAATLARFLLCTANTNTVPVLAQVTDTTSGGSVVAIGTVVYKRA